MGVIVLWFAIIIIIAVVKSSSKTGTQGDGNQKQKQNIYWSSNVIQPMPKPVQRPQEREVMAAYQKQPSQKELKERLEKKYKRSEGEILKRAKASVAEDFSKAEVTEYLPEQSNEKVMFENVDITPGKSSVAKQQEIERRVTEKMEKEEENGNLIKRVEDLMITGPNVGMTFERDFLAEGMDMLNRIQA